MTELDDPVAARFADHVDAVYRTLDALQPQLELAVDELADLLLAERRLVVAGLGTGAALAQIFAAGMLGRVRIERPGLPVILLGAEATVQVAVTGAYGADSALSRPLQALLQPGDAVLLVSQGSSATLAAAIRAARERDARALVLRGDDDVHDASHAVNGDIELRVPSDNPGCIPECQLLLLNCLAELLEQRLFSAD